MSNVYDIRNRDRLLDETSLWISRLDRGLDDAEREELRRFLDEPAHRATFLEMAELWDRTDVLSRLSEILPEVEQRPAGRRYAWAAAASIVVAAILGAFAFSINRQDGPAELEHLTSTSVYETTVGERSTISLPDGTAVVLNTNSRLEVEYSPQNRVLLLKRGEIHVDVVADASRPLSVTAGRQLIQAVGTEFSVRISDQHLIELIVIDGAVRIGIREPGTEVAANDEPPTLGDAAPVITAGNIAMLGGPTDTIEVIDMDEIHVKLSWRNGNLIFRGETLEEAMSEISRYTAVEFVFLDEDLKKISVAGMFRANDVDGLLNALRASFNITYERVGDNRVLLSRR